MTARRIIIWRHGQTEWNAQHRWQGQADVPLNDVGREQARATAPTLAGYGITHLYSSDLVRASETAGILAEIIGLPVSLDARLREIDVGNWCGRTKDQIGSEFTQVLILEEAGEHAIRGLTGESVREVAGRTSAALAEIAGALPDDAVVGVVMHGLAARVGAFELMGLKPDQAKAFRGLENCAWLVLDRGVRHDGVECWRLEAYNSRSSTVADARQCGQVVI